MSLLIWPLPRAAAGPVLQDAAADATPAEPVFVPLLGEPPLALPASPALGQSTEGESSPAALDPAPAPPVSSAPPVDTSASPSQQLQEQATLETRQPQVQWSPSGSTTWETVPTRQTVAAGDRVRTGAGASARLVYFEGTITEISADTGLLVQRLERTAGGNIVTNLFQSVGTTVNRVVQLVDPAAGFQVETPAATAFVRGTTPRLDVTRNGFTRVSNLPDQTGGLVDVVGKDPNATRVTLQPGQFTDVVPGQPPSSPSSIPAGGPGLGLELQQDVFGESAVLDRQQRQQQQRQQAEQQLAQAQLALAAGLAEAERFAAQEQLLIQQIDRLLAATPTPTPTTFVPFFPTATPTRFIPPPVGTSTPTPLALPTLAPGQLRIVLTWGASPRDLDSHLWVPTGGSNGTPVAAAQPADALASDSLRLLSRGDGPSNRFGFSSMLGQVTPTQTFTATPTRTVTPTITPTRTATPSAAFTEVYFGNRGSLTSLPFAQLDIDDTNGFGPETITIARLLPGQYTYAVHNFSGETALSASGAQVQVFSSTGVVATFTVPAGSGRWWTVFTINGSTGAITPVNTLSDSPPLPSGVGG